MCFQELCKTIDEEEAVKSAMEEERSYLDEIAREENLEIVIETEPDTEAESEQGVSIHMHAYLRIKFLGQLAIEKVVKSASC